MSQAADQRSMGGRPRNNDLTDKVLVSAEQLFGVKGFSAVTMAEIAAAAGVGLDTIYRRWSSKQALLLEIVAGAVSTGVPIIDLGNVSDDLTEAVDGLIRFATSPAGRVLAAAIGEAAHDTALASQLAEAQARRRDLARTIVTRAVERHEVRPDTDPDLLLDLLSGIVWHRAFVSGHSFRKDDARSIVTAALVGFRR